jgi:hypothetical protein
MASCGLSLLVHCWLAFFLTCCFYFVSNGALLLSFFYNIFFMLLPRTEPTLYPQPHVLTLASRGLSLLVHCCFAFFLTFCFYALAFDWTNYFTYSLVFCLWPPAVSLHLCIAAFSCISFLYPCVATYCLVFCLWPPVSPVMGPSASPSKSPYSDPIITV